MWHGLVSILNITSCLFRVHFSLLSAQPVRVTSESKKWQFLPKRNRRWQQLTHINWCKVGPLKTIHFKIKGCPSFCIKSTASTVAYYVTALSITAFILPCFVTSLGRSRQDFDVTMFYTKSWTFFLVWNYYYIQIKVHSFTIHCLRGKCWTCLS